MNIKKSLIIVFSLMVLTTPLRSQVLGPCGGAKATVESSKNIEVETTVFKSETSVNPIPLPGQQAIDFELTAVVGDQIKQVKLSDYQGKWRVVCFFPAAFTFV